MKKTKIITLFLITAALASCHKKKKHSKDWTDGNNVYMRSDESAGYSYMPNYWLWYYAFRPYGIYTGGDGYVRSGYYSNSISETSNLGHNATKNAAIRGGFGKSSFTVSS